MRGKTRDVHVSIDHVSEQPSCSDPPFHVVVLSPPQLDQRADAETVLSVAPPLSRNTPCPCWSSTRPGTLATMGRNDPRGRRGTCHPVLISTDVDSVPHQVHRGSAIRHGLYRAQCIASWPEEKARSISSVRHRVQHVHSIHISFFLLVKMSIHCFLVAPQQPMLHRLSSCVWPKIMTTRSRA